jgi:hypothetical protein
VGQEIRRFHDTMRFPLFPPTALLILAAACTALQPIGPEQLIGPHAPRTVLLTRVDHSVVVLDYPHVIDDTLVGVADGARQRVLLAQTAAIEAREAAPGRTAALVLGGVVAAVAATYLVNKATTHGCNLGYCTPAGWETCC